eukprot:SAG31_NODE_512_length_14721_cov_17.995623_5_plen_68_part_00
MSSGCRGREGSCRIAEYHLAIQIQSGLHMHRWCFWVDRYRSGTHSRRSSVASAVRPRESGIVPDNGA